MYNNLRLVCFLTAFCIGLALLSDVSAREKGTESQNKLVVELECMYECIADTSATMLLSIRNVIAKNQELINRDPETGNFYFKGFVPAVAGSRVANDFSLRTGYKLKQTALRVRNPQNKPDEWEEKTLLILEENGMKESFGEMTEMDGIKVYRYMKPLYMEKECVVCHSTYEAMPPEVRAYMESNYGSDNAMGYKLGDLRGGISIVVPVMDMPCP